MKFLFKKHIATALLIGFIFNANSQDFDAQMPRWFIGAGISGGVQANHISQNNWSAAYLNALNANIKNVEKSGGYNLGFDVNLGYFFGKSRNFGLGTGLQFINLNSDYGLNPMSIEYQSTDKFGSTFRQGIRSNKEIEETVKQNIWGIPLMVLYKKQITEKWGINMDAGLVFNIANKASYEAEAANFDYEAIYKLDNNGVPVYDNSPTPDPNSWLITKEHFEKVNPNGDVNAYFEDLYSQGYNVGLDVKPNTNSGEINNATVNTSWFIRPSISYRIKPNLAFHANLSYQRLKTNFSTSSAYRITDIRGTYASMTNGITSNSQGLINLGVGIRYYFGKERVKPAPEPEPAPVPVVKEDLNKEMVKVTVKLQDEKYGKPVEGNIVIKNGATTVYNGKADQSGISNFYLAPGKYSVGVTAKGYIPAEESLVLNSNEKGTSKTIELKQPKIEKGLEFKLKAINFETGSSQLTTSSYNILDKMADILIEYPQMVIEVAGHTDNVGDDQKNLELSQKRAEEVMNYLLAKGAKAKQMKAMGYGETKPVADNGTEEGRLQNRRVMFTVLEFIP